MRIVLPITVNIRDRGRTTDVAFIFKLVFPGNFAGEGINGNNPTCGWVT